MLESQQLNPDPVGHRPPPRKGRRKPDIGPPRVDFAKFPPDDDELPPGPPAGAPAGGGYDDSGDFKKGRFNPAVIIVAILAVGGLVAFLLVGFKQEEEKLTVENAEKEK